MSTPPLITLRAPSIFLSNLPARSQANGVLLKFRIPYGDLPPITGEGKRSFNDSGSFRLGPALPLNRTFNVERKAS